MIAVTRSAEDSANVPICVPWYASASSAVIVSPTTYPSPRGPIQPEITMGVAAVSRSPRSPSSSSTARRFRSASSAGEWPRRSAQSGFARQVAVSSTMPTPAATATST